MAFNSYLLTTSFNMELLILHLPTNPLPATQVFHQSTSQRIFPSKLPISVNLAPNLGGNHPSLSSSSTATSWGLPILYHLALKRISNPLFVSITSLWSFQLLTVCLLLPWPLHSPFCYTVSPLHSPFCYTVIRYLPLVLSKVPAPELFPWSLSQAFVLPACPALDMQISFQGLWFLRPLVFCFRASASTTPPECFSFLHGQLLIFL